MSRSRGSVLAGFIVMGAAGRMYLLRRDIWPGTTGPQAAAELGWLCGGPDPGDRLAVGPRGLEHLVDLGPPADYLVHSLGRAIPRTCSCAATWTIRTAAPVWVRCLAIVGMLDVPLVVMATRWFRGMHPVTPPMEPTMRTVLVITVLGFTALFVLLLRLRQAQLRLEAVVAELEGQGETRLP